MTRGAHAVLADALRLDLRCRTELAAELVRSIEEASDPDAAAAWNVEIRYRVAAIEAGTANLEPWEEVRRRFERKIRPR